MVSEARPIVVVGGGIGGVTAALALTRIAREVLVLERAATPADAGSGITLFPNAMAALDAIGVADAVRAVGVAPPLGSAGLRAPSGRMVVDAGSVPAIAGLYAFHRADLHRALRALLPPGVLRTGQDVAAVRSAPGGALVEIHGDSPIEAELVVAADGLRSRVRRQVHPDYPGPRYAGYTSWRGVTDHSVDLAGVAGETWGAGERFGILPLRDGRVYWFATANLAPGGVVDAHRETWRRFGSWHAPIPELLSATRPEAVLALDINDLPVPLPSFVVRSVALLGDAAHAMTPDVGQGAGQAIEDAVVLAARLAQPQSISQALDEYDRERRKRTQRLVTLARRTGRVAQADGRLAVMLRTAAIRLVPASIPAKTAERVMAWTPPVVEDRN